MSKVRTTITILGFVFMVLFAGPLFVPDNNQSIQGVVLRSWACAMVGIIAMKKVDLWFLSIFNRNRRMAKPLSGSELRRRSYPSTEDEILKRHPNWGRH